MLAHCGKQNRPQQYSGSVGGESHAHIVAAASDASRATSAAGCCGLSQMQKLVGVDDDPEAAWQAFRDVSIKYDRISARLELLAEAAGAPAGADDVLIK